MPPPPTASNIRAHVQWKESTVYAGEEIECIITFKNIARVPGRQRPGRDTLAPLGTNGEGHGRMASFAPSTTQHSRKNSIVQMKPAHSLSRATSNTSVKVGPPSRGHRPALSLNVVSASGRGGSLHTAPIQQNPLPNGVARPEKGHVRSLSIMSLGSEPASEGRAPVTVPQNGKRPVRVHARSASLQYPPKLTAQSPAMLSMSPRQPSPLYETTTPPELPEAQQLPLRPARRRPGTLSADTTPQLDRPPVTRKQSGKDVPAMNNFKFPPDPPSEKPHKIIPDPGSKPVRSPSNMHSGQKRSYSPRAPDDWSANIISQHPLSRLLSETSTEGTPRTSSEFYSISNNSNETLTSELPSQQQYGRLLPNMSHSRRGSRSPQARPAEPETLMMAYAQTMGHFTVDGGLVNAAPFEEVKRKGVQGGGGVVGIERSKRSSGLFGALSWGNIGESLGGLLGGDEMSSMAQMKASAGSKTIPLLSTPQTLLFVDLRLAPGESKSYSYRFSLPRGLPPTHRGRAMKVSYHLSLGVQRPEGQQVKHVEIPFRLLGSYDSQGDALGHDLMSPYVLLQDAARTMSITPDPSTPTGHFRLPSRHDAKNKKKPKQSLEDFLRYTERLIESPKEANGALLSPTSPVSPVPPRQTLSRQGSLTDQPAASIKEAIDFAILRSNVVSISGNQAQSQSTNRFNIARSGQPVAVLTILRPAYKLGESVTGTIDFTVPLDDSISSLPQASTYAVLIELESSEQVDPSLALRSAHSISRVTRKVYASVRENSLFARQVSFNLSIPTNAAPTFETTGISLGWRLKVEFTTHRQLRGLGVDSTVMNDGLLEELARDERGTTLIAREHLPADTFEIAVPLKVYGAVGIDSFSTDSESLYV